MNEFEQFRELLDEDEVFYKVDEFDDGRHIFRIPHKLKSGGMVEIVVIFEDDNIKILIMKLGNVEDPEKKAMCYELFNDLNYTYKYYKIYLDSDGDVMIACDVAMDVCRGEFYPKVLMAYIGSALRVASEVYPKIMKILWA